jgi:glycogen operon protein
VAIPAGYSRAAATGVGRNDPFAFKSVVADVGAYDWKGDQPLRRPFVQTVIYEMHVRGFTAHPSSGLDPAVRGTYAGVVEKIPYLQGLGITAVELMPVFQFDPQDAPPGLTNYWGYSPVSFFAPHCGYASATAPLDVLDEFRDMVKALHRAGIEVILDVVYNHTAESGHGGPTLSFRGLEDSVYYILENGGDYANYSGTGNTLNANQSIVRRLIIDSLHYWVEEMHIDGFRFDLASILSRDENGRPLPNPPILWDIESDPRLAGTKLIAEAWDAAGLYQVGTFVGDSWKEWNGRFRDDIRSFVRGDPGKVKALADRLLGSPDLYADQPREPERSINFVTSHDGFTLNDLVSYNHKHNESNLEDNRDGTDHNFSWNCGVEGPTDEPEIEAIRNVQIRNLLAITMLSLGAPMLLMGDEVRRTQAGNNNAYCQDNETSWFDWEAVGRHKDLIRFVRLLMAHVELHGVSAGEPDLAHHSRSLALSATNLSGDPLMYFALNAYWEPLQFQLPEVPVWAKSGWRRVIDTSLVPPTEITLPVKAPRVTSAVYEVAPRSVVVMFATGAD